MPILSDGLNYGIWTGRAAEHQRQSYVRLRPDRPYEHYFPLIDVIVERSTEAGDFVFTGQNVRQFLRALRKPGKGRDYAAFHAWLQSDAIFSHARERLQQLPDVPVNEYFKPLFRPNFYSLIAARLGKLSLRRATPQQWASTLTNMTRDGVKEEEIIWSGLRRYLSKQEGVVEKTDLLAAMDTSTFRLAVGTESYYGFRLLAPFLDCCKRLPLKGRRKTITKDRLILRYRHTSWGYGVAMLVSRDFFYPDVCWLAVDDRNRVLPHQPRAGFETPEGAKRFALRAIFHRYDVLSRDLPKVRWQNYALAEGEQYQEWLLTLPDYPQTFRTSHFVTHNVLVHVRSTLRRDLNDRRMLFLEEVQSDWHQRGRQFGYLTPALQVLSRCE